MSLKLQLHSRFSGEQIQQGLCDGNTQRFPHDLVVEFCEERIPQAKDCIKGCKADPLYIAGRIVLLPLDFILLYVGVCADLVSHPRWGFF